MTFLPLSRLLSVGRPGDWPVATTQRRDIVFATFRNDVAWNAARLREAGCRRGLLVAKDGYWAAVGVFALLHARAVVILPSNPQAAEREAFDADLVVSEDFLQSTEQQSGPLEELDPDQSHLELYTSGSTGEPKRIVKSLREMDAEAAAIERALGCDLLNAAVFGTVPHHHLYGLSFRLFWPLCTGRPLVAETYAFWESLVTDLTAECILVTSPAHLMRIPPIPAAQTPRIGMILSAGAVLPDDAALAAGAALRCPVTDIFGSTETGVVAYRSRQAPAASWHVFPGVDIKRLDDGRMSVRANHLGTGDWHETADVIALHNDGTFDLLGRSDRVVKIEGNRISLADIETKLRAAPLVQAAAVLALETKPASLGAAIVLTAEGKTELQQIGAFRLGRQLRRNLAETLPSAALPRHWRFVPELPVASLGKTREADLAALFSKRREEPQEPILRAEQRSENALALELFIPVDLPCLRGHFPGLPIVPGVAQLDWAVKHAARGFALPIASATKFQIKFKRVTVAPSDLTLTLRHHAAERQVVFEYRQGEAVVSHGSFAVDSGA